MAGRNPGQDYVRAGTIQLYQKRSLNKKLAHNKSYYAKLMASTQSGVARLELYDSQKQSISLLPCEMVVGSDVVKVDRVPLQEKDKRNAFLISTKEHHYTFYVPDTHTCDDWLKDIRETLLGEVHSGGSPHDKKGVSQVNDLYESADKFFPQSNEFIVTIEESTRAKMGVDGKVRLVVESDSIAIVTTSGKMIVRWALKNLRKFSYQDKMFIVEAGRKSTLGEGNFSFHTDEGEGITAVIDKRKRALKQKHTTATEPSSALGFPPPSNPPKPRVELQTSYFQPDDLYDTLENVVIPPNHTPTWTPPDNKVMSPENKSESLARPVSPFSPPKNIKSPSTKQQPTRGASRDEPLGQNTGIYSEPELITDAWKTHATNDDEDSGSMYSNFNRARPEVEEDHYWRGQDLGAQSGEVKPEDDNIYAVVDLSKKNKNKK